MKRRIPVTFIALTFLVSAHVYSQSDTDALFTAAAGLEWGDPGALFANSAGSLTALSPITNHWADYQLAINDRLELFAAARRRANGTDLGERQLLYQSDLRELSVGLAGGDRLNWRVDYGYRVEDRLDTAPQLIDDSQQPSQGLRTLPQNSYQLRGQVNWDWNNRWYQSLEATVRQTDYRDPDLYFIDFGPNALTSLSRRANRFTFRTEVGRWIGDRLRIAGLVEYQEENANNDLYDFDGMSLSIGLDYTF